MSNSILAGAGIPREGPIRAKIVELLGGEPSTSSVEWNSGVRAHRLCRDGESCVVRRLAPLEYEVSWERDGIAHRIVWRAVVTWSEVVPI